MFRTMLVARSTLSVAYRFLNATQVWRPVVQNISPVLACRRSYANLVDNKEATPNLAEDSDSDETLKIDPEKKRKILELEMEVMRQEGRKVPTPSKIKHDHWQHLLALKSRNQRRQYYLYLWNTEMAKESELVKKEQRKLEIAKRKEELIKANAENDHLVYGLFHNTMFLRIYDSTMDHWHNNKYGCCCRHYSWFVKYNSVVLD